MEHGADCWIRRSVDFAAKCKVRFGVGVEVEVEIDVDWEEEEESVVLFCVFVQSGGKSENPPFVRPMKTGCASSRLCRNAAQLCFWQIGPLKSRLRAWHGGAIGGLPPSFLHLSAFLRPLSLLHIYHSLLVFDNIRFCSGYETDMTLDAALFTLHFVRRRGEEGKEKKEGEVRERLIVRAPACRQRQEAVHRL